jgi:hypothetical protein
MVQRDTLITTVIYVSRRLFFLVIISVILIGCQKNYYLIEEAYYQGHYFKTVTRINQLHDDFPKQINSFLSHSEKRLRNKLQQSSKKQFTRSDFYGLCYINALLPELTLIQTHFPASHFQDIYTTLNNQYRHKLPSFLMQEQLLGTKALNDHHYFRAMAHFKRYLHFQDNPLIEQNLKRALSQSKIHLTIDPFEASANRPEILFGINVINTIFTTIDHTLTNTPISFVTVEPATSPSPRASFQLTGSITSTYKDTQVVPELITLSDTLRYQHEVGGIIQWDNYDFEYTVERVEFSVKLEGHFTLTHANGNSKMFKITTNYGQHSQYKKDTFNLPNDSYRIEFPVRYMQFLEIPLLIEETEIVNEAVHIFSDQLYKELTHYFNKITLSKIPSQCPNLN